MLSLVNTPNAISAPVSPEKAQPPLRPEKRRSTRLSVAVPVTLVGNDAGGEKFLEECKTVSIDRNGATIETSRVIARGTELLIRNVSLGITVRARAVRFIEREASGRPSMVGVELIDSGNVWGIQYPPKNWQRAAPPARKQERAAPAPSPVNVIEIDLSDALPPSLISNVAESAPGRSLEHAATLAERAGEIDVKSHSGAHRLLDPPQEGRKALLALEERLASMAQSIAGSFARLEGLISQAREAEQHARNEVEKAGKRLEESCAESEAHRPRIAGEAKEQISGVTESLLEEFLGQLNEAAQSVRELMISGVSQGPAARVAAESGDRHARKAAQ
jgi:hypothetical protein